MEGKEKEGIERNEWIERSWWAGGGSDDDDDDGQEEKKGKNITKNKNPWRLICLARSLSLSPLREEGGKGSVEWWLWLMTGPRSRKPRDSFFVSVVDFSFHFLLFFVFQKKNT
jgi:hypothetical protein